MALFGPAVEYALHTVLNLVLLDEDEHVSARRLAEIHDLPLAYMRKLMTRLEQGGIVCGSEGRGGGWRLARPGTAISLLDVVDAVSEQANLFACREIRRRGPEGQPDAQETTFPAPCAIHSAMLRAEQAMRATLRQTTIDDIAAGVRKGYGTDWLRPQTGEASP